MLGGSSAARFGHDPGVKRLLRTPWPRLSSLGADDAARLESLAYGI
jgi:hypothetical protein